MGASLPTTLTLPVSATAGFRLVELRAASGLTAQFLPTGALFALRHGPTLVNQVLPGPAEDGLFRLLLRATDAAGAVTALPLVGPTVAFAPAGAGAVRWHATAPGLDCHTTFALDPSVAGWTWRSAVRNTGAAPRRLDVLHAQDLGLADEGAVRNNEAYTSHYLDLLPVEDAALGWVVLARQNQAMTGGRHPWLACACATGAAGFCTDGTQFFGPEHRLTGEPAAVRAPALPSRRLQSESATAGLQSRAVTVAPGATAEFVFVARFVEHHPATSVPEDVALLRVLVERALVASAAEVRRSPGADPAEPSVFLRCDWQHGDAPTEADWAAWFPGARRHEERGAAGELLAFFHGDDTHVVSRAKEAALARPHGHILRSGRSDWIDDEQFGVTCYAAGIFGAQAYFGNPSFARLLPVVRHTLNVLRGSGQRVFVRRAAADCPDGGGPQWRQLGVPSAFALRPGEVRWLYRLESDVISARVWCAADLPASFLELRVEAGERCEFLVTHQLALGAVEFEHPGTAEIWAEEGWIGFQPGADTLMARHQPGACFALAAAGDGPVTLGGDGQLYCDGRERGGPYATLRTGPVRRCGAILLGTHEGAGALPAAVVAARAAFARPGAVPPAPPLRLAGGRDPGVARLDEILPWFAHNASIHFSAPHGLEQTGGAAWGVRDVCQGSVEWLLAAGEFATVRRVLRAVFAQQYPREGAWPQWFMHAPYHFIQQTHSHGDVCFWPVKALCDYAEAANDPGFLGIVVGYTDPRTFGPAGPEETLWQHCDRVVAHCEARFVPGTALVNYGDGDWDDTLQPADPAMRTRMISAWTVALAFHAFRLLAGVSRRAGETARADRLDALLARMRRDFAGLLMPDGTVAGFLVSEPGGRFRPLLHPRDEVTGMHYRLLPMTRAVLAELFTPEEAHHHFALIAEHLAFPDGVRLMDRPATYHGGRERIFKRADTAANVGREIGLAYIHANLRYVEALAQLGEADRLWAELQRLNPVALARVVPNAAARQSNVYFSSSDADFADRPEATARWEELRRGTVPVRGGWRLYSSGPGLFLHKVRACLLGVRESFGDVVFDPVLPLSLDGVCAVLRLCDRPVTVCFRVKSAVCGPRLVTVNGQEVPGTRRESHPYRVGGLRVPGAACAALLRPAGNHLEVVL